MRRRNWEYLSRKLVDSTDLDFSFNAVQAYMAENNLAFFGSGVLITTQYPNPFVISKTGMLTGQVGRGVAYDPTGLQVRIDNESPTFTVEDAGTGQTRMDLLVLRYKARGQTLIPEPDLPTQEVYLNILDGYELGVIKGGDNYPAKGQYDIILCGLVAADGTFAPDLSVRDIATPLRAFFPTFAQERVTGAVDGTNASFTLAKEPLNSASVLVSVNGIALTSAEWSLSGSTLTLNDPPQPGQDVYAYYVVNAVGTVNPVAGAQETPVGIADGTNQTFALSGTPVDQNSTQVFVDGLLTPIEGWALNQNQTASAIVFNAGYIPVQGQSVYVFYLRNAVAISGQGASSSSPTTPTTPSSIQLSTEYPQLSAIDVNNGFIALAHTPIQPTMVLVDIIGDSAQAYGIDFTVSGNQLNFLGDIKNTLAQGDRLRVHYAY